MVQKVEGPFQTFSSWPGSNFKSLSNPDAETAFQ